MLVKLHGTNTAARLRKTPGINPEIVERHGVSVVHDLLILVRVL